MTYATCYVHSFPVKGCPDCTSLRSRTLLTGIEREALDGVRARNLNDPADRLPLHHWDELMRDIERESRGDVS